MPRAAGNFQLIFWFLKKWSPAGGAKLGSQAQEPSWGAKLGSQATAIFERSNTHKKTTKTINKLAGNQQLL